MNGYENLKRACEQLSADEDSRRKLTSAAREFELAAARGYANWPPEMQRQADGIRSLLFRHGVPEQTIERLSDAGVADAIKNLQRFCDEFDRQVACH